MNLHALKAALRAACLVALASSGAAWSQASAPVPNASSPGLAPTGAAGASSATTAAVDCPPTAKPLTRAQIADSLQRATDHGFLWRITKGGRTSYLFGTIHAAMIDWVFPGPSILEAINASDTIALELDLLDPDIRQRLAEAVKAKAGDTLPAPLAARMRARMAAECVDAEALSALGPELQMASLTVLSARRSGIDPAYAIDINLAAFGRYVKKPVVSLETPELQGKVLQMAPADRQAFISTGLDDLDSGRAGPILERIATIWALSDWKSLSSYKEWCLCQRTPGERALMKRLLDDRNVPLAARIDSIHASGKRVFAAVGVLHMTGPNGLPALLKKRGYKIEEGDFTR